MKTLFSVLLCCALLLLLVTVVSAQCPDQGTWQEAQFNIGTDPTNPIAMANPLLLTDGRVMIQYVWQGSNNLGLNTWQDWFALTPNPGTPSCTPGSYSFPCGMWSGPGDILSLHNLWVNPTQYGPTWFASAVLADDKVIVEGGEYNLSNNHQTFTNLGALYDPVMNLWTQVQVSPNQWSHVGDAPSVVLPNKTFMIGNNDDTNPTNEQQALFNESAPLNWTFLTNSGKADNNSEEGWTLLPNGKVLTVDVNTPGTTNSELFDPLSQTWSLTGSTGVTLYGCENDDPNEIGPAVLMPDRTVFATGAIVHSAPLNCNSAATVAHTAIYSPSSGQWSAGPDLPSVSGVPLDLGDSPAALLPDGNVLMIASPDCGGIDCSAYALEYLLHQQTICQISNVPPDLASTWSNLDAMLVLPTGQIFVTTRTNSYFIYTPADGSGTYPGIAPTVDQLQQPLITIGQTYTLIGTQFNGASQASSFGDDFQNATNYPLVRITDDSSGHIAYARTHDHGTMGVATGNLPSATHFDVLSGTETGVSHLVVVANGIASNSIRVTVTGMPEH